MSKAFKIFQLIVILSLGLAQPTQAVAKESEREGEKERKTAAAPKTASLKPASAEREKEGKTTAAPKIASLKPASAEREKEGKTTAAPKIASLKPASAEAGALITLTGSGFGLNQDKAAVRFGSAKAAIQSWSDTKITAQAPPGTGEVKVSVSNAKGLSTGGTSFLYLKSSGGTGGGGGGSTGGISGLSNFKVFANNDLGMHCVDKDFSVFSILPPYNVVNAQVIGQNATTGKPTLLGNDTVVLRYSPIADATGSVNSTVNGKTNFWQYAAPLFGVNLDPRGQGLKGLYMPADAPSAAQTQFSWNNGLGLFAAEGIPIFPVDDAGKANRYPLLRVTAFDKLSGKELAHTDTVVPVSEETTCANCHATGKQAAVGNGWSADADVEIQTRTNILILHDLKKGTRLQASQPVLCASCHYSAALDLAGNGPVGEQVGKSTMSAAMHSFHAPFNLVDGKALFDTPAPVAGLDPALKGVPPADQQTCYQCHPGKDTKCLRGAMTETVTCQNCHGDMKAVGGQVAMKGYGPINGRNTDLNRHPWGDEPRCQSCHTGDSLNHLDPATAQITDPVTGLTKKLDNQLAADGLRLMLSYDRQDAAASPLLAVNKRFAENDGKLFRHSKGHGNLACEACHGSTHAIWPGDAAHPNDNVTAAQLQGHMGVIAECTTCHKAGSLPLTLNGPHGMHNVGDARWLGENGHPSFYRQNAGACQSCHGKDLRGTVLSRVAADRSYQTEWGVRTRKKGEAVGCWTCHNGPNGD